jgi:UDP-2,3-diacylglucosamine hydrolase
MSNLNGKIYFASDFHLGIPDRASSLAREKRIVRWLEEAEKDAAEIFLVGDLFDAWFEYKRAVPKGFIRLLGKIAAITDKGIPVHVFSGNHDMWMFGYMEEECGVKLHHEPVEREWNGKKFFIAHGDGLGPGDHGYKFIKKIFRNKFSQWLYARFHPNFGLWLADAVSRQGLDKKEDQKIYHGDDKEFLVLFCKEYIRHHKIDYFVFGHRHLPLDMKIGDTARYINLGDWLSYDTYAVFDGNELKLKEYTG